MAQGRAPGRGGVTRAVGAAALPFAALYVAHHLAGVAAGLLPPAGGEAAAAAILALAAAWGAPPLARRLGAGRQDPAPARAGAVVRGLLEGAAAAAVLTGLLAATGGVRWAPGLRTSPAVAAAALLAASLGYAQEAFARGSALGVLEARTGPRTALWGAAALGAVTAWLWGAGVLGAGVIFALGLWWGRGRLRSGTAAGAEAAHAAWAVALGPLLGIGGEGLGPRLAPVRPSLLAAHLGSILWAGAPGPDQGGLAALLVAAAAAALSAVSIIRRPAS